MINRIGEKFLKIDDLAMLLVKSLVITILSVIIEAGVNNLRPNSWEWDGRTPPPCAPKIEDVGDIQTP